MLEYLKQKQIEIESKYNLNDKAKEDLTRLISNANKRIDYIDNERNKSILEFDIETLLINNNLITDKNDRKSN